MKKLLFSLLAFLLLFVHSVMAQDAPIDASKPTNFYSQVDIQFESAGSQNQYGLRNSFIIAPSEKHLILGELPILTNTQTNETGIGDIRLRYFYLP